MCIRDSHPAVQPEFPHLRFKCTEFAGVAKLHFKAAIRKRHPVFFIQPAQNRKRTLIRYAVVSIILAAIQPNHRKHSHYAAPRPHRKPGFLPKGKLRASRCNAHGLLPGEQACIVPFQRCV